MIGLFKVRIETTAPTGPAQPISFGPSGIDNCFRPSTIPKEQATNATFPKLNSHGADRSTGSAHEYAVEFMSSRVRMPAADGKIILPGPTVFPRPCIHFVECL
jgi:hypothetical protein